MHEVHLVFDFCIHLTKFCLNEMKGQIFGFVRIELIKSKAMRRNLTEEGVANEKI